MSCNMFATALLAALALATSPMVISWGDLVPENEAMEAFDSSIQQHDEPAQQRGSANTVADLDGQEIRMPGFMLPLDYTEDDMVGGFLLVPYYGACIHVPPPPPNQIVYVDASAAPVEPRGLWDPVWVEGRMELQMNINELGDAAYTLRLSKVEPYED